MKPLELTSWPLWFNGLDGTCYADKEDEWHPVNVDFEVLRKHLTDAELTAEYWHARWDYSLEAEYGSEIETIGDRLDTIERFATTPSYDE